MTSVFLLVTRDLLIRLYLKIAIAWHCSLQLWGDAFQLQDLFQLIWFIGASCWFQSSTKASWSLRDCEISPDSDSMHSEVSRESSKTWVAQSHERDRSDPHSCIQHTFAGDANTQLLKILILSGVTEKTEMMMMSLVGTGHSYQHFEGVQTKLRWRGHWWCQHGSCSSSWSMDSDLEAPVGAGLVQRRRLTIVSSFLSDYYNWWLDPEWWIASPEWSHSDVPASVHASQSMISQITHDQWAIKLSLSSQASA